MNESLANRLSQIVTQWSLLRQAHGDEERAARAAQERLLTRYGGAIRRYLLGCTKQADLAEELFQEFALRLLKGGLSGADQNKGRFRHYLKGVLFHLLADHHQKLKKQPAPWHSELPEPSAGQESQNDLEFLATWRTELLALTWKQLQAEDEQTSQHYFQVLEYRRDHPEERSEAMAQTLSKHWGKPLTAAGVRQLLHRARERFADLLLDSIMHSLSCPSLEDLHQELVELQLLQYCQPALDRYQPPGTAQHES